MKNSLLLSLAALLLVGGFAFKEARNNKLLTQQVADYAQQNSQLLTRIEENSLQNLEHTETLQSLQSDIKNRDKQIAALHRQLATAQQQVDPNYQEIETRIRQQLSQETQANNSATHSDPKLSMLLQLSELDPVEVGEIIAVNAQFGEFINSLSVSEERKEVIINALQNLIADQNQLRMEVMQEMRANPQIADRGEIFQKMRAITSPEAQLDALSYDLTESELSAFSDFQEQRPSYLQSGRPMSGFSSGAVFSSGDVIQVEPGQAPAVQLQLLPSPSIPAN